MTRDKNSLNLFVDYDHPETHVKFQKNRQKLKVELRTQGKYFFMGNRERRSLFQINNLKDLFKDVSVENILSFLKNVNLFNKI